jgi:hypothetical protein
VRDIAPEISEIGADLIKGAEALLPVLEPIVKALLAGLHELFGAARRSCDELAAQDPAITAGARRLLHHPRRPRARDRGAVR